MTTLETIFSRQTVEPTTVWYTVTVRDAATGKVEAMYGYVDRKEAEKVAGLLEMAHSSTQYIVAVDEQAE